MLLDTLWIYSNPKAMNVLHCEAQYMCTSIKHWVVEHPDSMVVGNDIGFKRVSLTKYIFTATHIGFYDVPIMSLKVVFSSCFIICDTCVTKIPSSPIPCNKRSSVTKTCFFVINLMTIILSSLICDTHFSS